MIHSGIADSELIKVIQAVDSEKGAGIVDFASLESLLVNALNPNNPPATAVDNAQNAQSNNNLQPTADMITLKKENFIFRSEYFKAVIHIDWAIEEEKNIQRQFEIYIHRPMDIQKPIRIYRRQLLAHAG